MKEKREQIEKPPLGLTPKHIRQSQRLNEIRGAIARYYDANKELPIEWVEEYNELIRLIEK